MFTKTVELPKGVKPGQVIGSGGATIKQLKEQCPDVSFTVDSLRRQVCLGSADQDALDRALASLRAFFFKARFLGFDLKKTDSRFLLT